VQQVVASGVVVAATGVIWKVILKRSQVNEATSQRTSRSYSRIGSAKRGDKFNIKSVEGGSYDRSLDEPPGIADRIKKGQSFLHTILARRR
jgi:hypothetical protein